MGATAVMGDMDSMGVVSDTVSEAASVMEDLALGLDVKNDINQVKTTFDTLTKIRNSKFKILRFVYIYSLLSVFTKIIGSTFYIGTMKF